VARRQLPTNWREKLHPAFFEVAELNKRFELDYAKLDRECATDLRQLRKDDPRHAERVRRFEEAGNQLTAWCGEQLDAINQRYPHMPYNPRAYSYLYGASAEPEPEQGKLARFLHWLRHRESLDAATTEDNKGSLSAFRRIMRTAEDFRRILQRLGRIKPFQGDMVHRQFLEIIICFENEQTPLTADERAACADAYCGCGKEEHDADALKKQYARLKRELDAAYRAQQAARSNI
jgi:hypothetical protein